MTESLHNAIEYYSSPREQLSGNSFLIDARAAGVNRRYENEVIANSNN